MFVVRVVTIVYMSIADNSLANDNKPKAKDCRTFRAAAAFLIYFRITATKVAYFYNVDCYTQFVTIFETYCSVRSTRCCDRVQKH